jgi:S1-C subfamily serine protease
LSFGRTGSFKLGDPVFTIGYPASDILGPEPKFTDGSISSLSGLGGEASLLQITVPIQPGNSGGPLVNEQGYAIGVVTSSAAVRPFLQATGTLPQNINWAVKADYAVPLFEVPSSQPPAKDRAEAIGRTKQATCTIEVLH